MLYSIPSSRKTKRIAMILFVCVSCSRLFAQYQATSSATYALTPRTDVYAIFSIPPDERSWPALDSLGVGWVRLQNQMGQANQQQAIQFFSRVLTEGNGLWLTLHHRERSNIADTVRFDDSSRGSFPPADSLKYKDLVRSNIQPLADLLTSQGKDPGKWLVVQFANEVVPDDVLERSPTRFFHGTSDEYLETLAYTYRAVKSIDPAIPVAFGAISSLTLKIIVEAGSNPSDSLQRVIDWNERLLTEAIVDWADIHLYHSIEKIPAKVAWVRQHWHGPLAATEVGGPDERTGVQYSDSLQAAKLPDRINTTLEAGVDRVFWAFLRDLDIPDDPLAQTLGLIDRDWQYKSAFPVYRDLIAAAVTSVSEDPVPTGFSLSQNYPNPFNPETTIRFSLPFRQRVTLRVFDLLGRTIAVLVDRTLDPGEHAVVFSAANLSSGVYFYQLQAGRNADTRKLLLVR